MGATYQQVEQLFFTEKSETPQWQIEIGQYLLQYPEYTKKLEHKIDSYYLEDDSYKNGYARLGYIYLGLKQYEQAIKYFEYDIDHGRIKWWLSIRYAEVLFHLKKQKEAELWIEGIYKKYTETKNGYAALATICRSENSNEQACLWYEKDYQLNKLTAICKLQYAEVLAAIGNIEKALSLLDDAYKEGNHLKDGYSIVGWLYYFQQGDNKNALKLLEKDYKSNRMSASWKRNLTQLYSLNKQLDSALSVVSEAYHESDDIKDGYSIVGWNYYFQQGDNENALKLLEKDYKSNRISTSWKRNLAQLYSLNKQLDNALSVVSEAYQESDDLKDGYAIVALNFYHYRNDQQKIYYYFTLDYKQNRLSDNLKLKYIDILADNHEHEVAHQLLWESDQKQLELSMDINDAIVQNEKTTDFFIEGVKFYEKIISSRALTRRENETYARFVATAYCYDNVAKNNNVYPVEQCITKHFYAYYDLNYAPATFDLYGFLFRAEDYAIRNHYDYYTLVIPHGSDQNFRDGYTKRYNLNSLDTIEWRFSNIVLPSYKLFPHCKSAQVIAKRDEYIQQWDSFFKTEDIFPPKYNPYSLGIYWGAGYDYHGCQNNTEASLRPTAHGLTHVQNWLSMYNPDNKKTIVITLRECQYEDARNSALSEWVKFADSLDKEIYCPIFVRDTEAAFIMENDNLLKEQLIFHEACWNIELRAALYHKAYLNMSSNNGPNLLFILNRQTSYLHFKVLENRSPAASKTFLQSQGLEEGMQFSFASKYQRAIWKDDTFYNLNEEFHKICSTIERDKKI